MSELTNTTQLQTVESPVADDMAAIAQRYQLSCEISKGMAAASLLPAHLRTKRVDGVVVDLDPEEVRANCALVVNQALRWGVDPFALAPESYVVGGKLAYQGKLVAAIINRLAGLRENLRYEFTGAGDNLAVRVIGHLRNEHDPRTVELRLVDARTDNDMWQDDPEQKLCYSGAIRWARRHSPETLLGIIGEDEPVIDSVAVEPRGRMEELTQATQAKESYLARIGTAQDRGRLEEIVEAFKTDGRLRPAEIKNLVDQAKKRWVELGQAADPEPEPEEPADLANDSYARWQRTLQTVPHDQMAEALEEVAADPDLTDDEKESLATLAKSILGNPQTSA